MVRLSVQAPYNRERRGSSGESERRKTRACSCSNNRVCVPMLDRFTTLVAQLAVQHAPQILYTAPCCRFSMCCTDNISCYRCPGVEMCLRPAKDEPPKASRQKINKTAARLKPGSISIHRRSRHHHIHALLNMLFLHTHLAQSALGSGLLPALQTLQTLPAFLGRRRKAYLAHGDAKARHSALGCSAGPCCDTKSAPCSSSLHPSAAEPVQEVFSKLFTGLEESEARQVRNGKCRW